MKNFPLHLIKGLFFTLIMLFANVSSFAQSDTISTIALHDAESLIKDFFLAGNCIDVFNFQLTGEHGQAGIFYNGMASIGLDSGIVLSTGNILDIVGPNSSPQTSTLYGNLGNDVDLETLDTIFTGNPIARTLSDIVILEFDFTPTVEQASFDFVFASEEYCYFNLTSFIDIFGFFVSGPGLNGPYQNNGINVALVPGTDVPITAFTINNFNNAAFYVNNTIPVAPDDFCSIGIPAAPDLIEFDGYTTPLVARFSVIPCETYHVKLAITDTTDDILDSAVFLKAQSFVAGRTSTISSNIMGENAGENAPYEGCGSADIIFSRGDLVDTNDLVVHYEILPSSNATPGIDFTPLPDSIIIAAGVMSDTVHLEFFSDNINEGNEIFTIKLRNPCSCTESELTFTIIDPLSLSGSIEGANEICNGDALELIATPSGGFGNITYQWSNGDTDSIYNVVPDETAVHQLILTDDCLQSDTIDFAVALQSPQAYIDGNGVICDGLPDFSYFVALTDGDVFSFDILENGNLTTYNNITADTFWIPVTETGVFQLANAIADGCLATTDGFAQALRVDITTQLNIDSISCVGLNDAIAAVRPTGGDGVYSYDWSHDNQLNQDTAFNMAAGDYGLLISDSQGCQDSISFTIDPAILFSLTIDTLQLEADCAGNGSLLAVASGGKMPYTYDWSNGITTALNNNLSAGIYLLTAADANDCSEELEIEITDNGSLPFIQLFADNNLDCSNQSVNITTGSSSTGTQYIYTWTNSSGDTLLPADEQNWSTNIPDTYTLEIKDTTSSCSNNMDITITKNGSAPSVTILADLITLDCYQGSSNLSAQENNQAWVAVWYDINADTVLATNQWSIDVFAAGDYELVVTNMDNNCVGRDSIRITQQTAPPLATIPLPDSLNCLTSEVDLSVNITVGSGSYNYQWTGVAGGISGSGTQATVTAILPGTYQLVLVDVLNGCNDTLITTVVNDNTPPQGNILTTGELNCEESDLNLAINISAGSGDYTYMWSGPPNGINGAINEAIVSIDSAGNYTLTLTDNENGCSSAFSTEVIKDDDFPEITPLPDTLINCFNPVITLTANAVDVDNLVFQWFDEDDILVSSSADITVSAAGIYTLQLTNNDNNCTAIYTTTVEADFKKPSANAGQNAALGCGNEAVLLAAIEGNESLIPSWFNENNLLLSTGEWTYLTNVPGLYQLSIFDSQNGCTARDTAIVEQNLSIPNADAGLDVMIDCFDNIAIIDASASTTGANITYSLFNESGELLQSGNTTSFPVNQTGNYQLIVTNNNNNCSDQDSVLVTIETPEITAINSINTYCFAQENSLVIEVVTGGTPPYLYSIDDGLSYQSSNVFNRLTEGSYQVLVQDINSCIGKSTGIIQAPEEVILTLPEVVYLAVGERIILTPTLINSDTAELIAIQWSDSSQLTCTSCFSPEFYAQETQRLTLRIIDKNGCELNAQVLIIVDQRIPIYIPTAFSPHNGDGINDLFVIYGGDNSQIDQINYFNIFDRWGNLVFSITNAPLNSPQNAWDGRFNGQQLSSGVFVYSLELLLLSGKSIQMKGEVMLLN